MSSTEFVATETEDESTNIYSVSQDSDFSETEAAIALGKGDKDEDRKHHYPKALQSSSSHQPNLHLGSSSQEDIQSNPRDSIDLHSTSMTSMDSDSMSQSSGVPRKSSLKSASDGKKKKKLARSISVSFSDDVVGGEDDGRALYPSQYSPTIDKSEDAKKKGMWKADAEPALPPILLHPNLSLGAFSSPNSPTQQSYEFKAETFDLPTCFKLCETDSPEMLLGLQALGLCSITYNNARLIKELMKENPPPVKSIGLKGKSKKSNWMTCCTSDQQETVSQPGTPRSPSTPTLTKSFSFEEEDIRPAESGSSSPTTPTTPTTPTATETTNTPSTNNGKTPLTKAQRNKIDKESISVERLWTKHVDITNRIVWDEEMPSFLSSVLCWGKGSDGNYLESQCVTGVINLKNGSGAKDTERVPFIAFRGSISEIDWWRDIKSIKEVNHISERGKTFVKDIYNKLKNKPNETIFEHITETINEFLPPTSMSVGEGFSEMYKELRKLQVHKQQNGSGRRKGITLMKEIVRLINVHNSGLIITGHSLGGGCANIFLLELLLDYPDLIELYKDKIRLITFGSPRCIGKEIANYFDYLPIQHLRYVNHDDIITGLSPQRMEKFYHAGKTFYPFLPDRLIKLKETLNPLDPLVMPDWKELDVQFDKSRWMLIYDPKDASGVTCNKKFYNFSANGLSDEQQQQRRDDNYFHRVGRIDFLNNNLPLGYRKNRKVHDIIDKKGYISHFAHCEDGSRTSATAILYLDIERKVGKLTGIPMELL